MILNDNAGIRGNKLSKVCDLTSSEKKSHKDLRFGDSFEIEANLVVICWTFAGHRLEETVPISKAKYRRLELEAKGAVIYWSERVLPSH